MLALAPCHMSVFVAYRNMQGRFSPDWNVEGFLWFQDLNLPDCYTVLPVSASYIEDAKTRRLLHMTSFLIGAVTLPVTAWLSAGFNIYCCSNVISGMALSALLRVGNFRRLFGLKPNTKLDAEGNVVLVNPLKGVGVGDGGAGRGGGGMSMLEKERSSSSSQSFEAVAGVRIPRSSASLAIRAQQIDDDFYGYRSSASTTSSGGSTAHSSTWRFGVLRNSRHPFRRFLYFSLMDGSWGPAMDGVRSRKAVKRGYAHLPPGPFILVGLALLANGLWKQYQMRQDVLTLGKEDAAKKWCPDVISKAAEKQRKIMGEANIVE
eukprot:g15461.t1